jgi:hypothetical protein
MDMHGLRLACGLLTGWGDMVSAAGDKVLALKIYQLCGASGKVCRFLLTGVRCS